MACAQCHDHKFDPIPTQDFYSLQGILSNTEEQETPLAPPETVSAWQARKKKLDKQQATLDRFYETQREQLAEILVSATDRYLLAVRKLGPADGLDAETLERWR